MCKDWLDPVSPEIEAQMMNRVLCRVGNPFIRRILRYAHALATARNKRVDNPDPMLPLFWMSHHAHQWLPEEGFGHDDMLAIVLELHPECIEHRRNNNGGIGDDGKIDELIDEADYPEDSWGRDNLDDPDDRGLGDDLGDSPGGKGDRS